MDHGIRTHIGQRPQNQDNVLTVTGGWGSLFAVADGMGGHAGGALASRLACERLADFFADESNGRGRKAPDALSRRLVEAVLRTDWYIRRYGRLRREFADMGTTLSSLLVTGTHGVIAHVGDSRIYRLRRGRLNRLTVDHTFVQDMIFEGEITPSQALIHPFRHMLTRAVGTEEPLEFVDSRIDKIKTGDRFLLCSDGLTGVLKECIILETLGNMSTDAAHTAARLVDKAIQKGARDNVTAIIVCP